MPRVDLHERIVVVLRNDAQIRSIQAVDSIFIGNRDWTAKVSLFLERFITVK